MLHYVMLCLTSHFSAHSQGWFGLWIFEDMFPHDSEGLGKRTGVVSTVTS